MIVNFEDITNHIGVLIQNDTDIQTYAQTNLGGTLNIVDNEIIKNEYIPDFPMCVISKDDERVFKNERSLAEGKSNVWYGKVILGAEFSEEQINDNNFKLPTSARQTLNGILTNMPSDFMRIITRKIGELITEKVGCGSKTAGVTLSEYSILVDDYYANENGVVLSQLNFEVYKRGNYIN